MRKLWIFSGVLFIVVYSVYGMLVINDFAVVAASSFPLEAAISQMEAAGQPHSNVGGYLFAGFGILLALVWSLLVGQGESDFSPFASIVAWAGILFLGAPAFFFTAFGNLNAVGDTFYDWNPDAAFAYEWPLYLASGLAVLIILGSVFAALAFAKRQPRQAKLS